MVVVALVLVASTRRSEFFWVRIALLIATESTGLRTVMAELTVTLPRVAVMPTGVLAATGWRAMVKSTLVAPAGTVTAAGTEAMAGFALDSCTVPAVSAGLL